MDQRSNFTENLVQLRPLRVPAIHNTAPCDVPFVMPVFGTDDEFALCVPCDRATWGNRYALSDGRVVRAEAHRINTGEGWRPMCGETIIGYVVSVQKRGNGSWNGA